MNVGDLVREAERWEVMGEVLSFPDVRLERVDLDRGLDPDVMRARSECSAAMRRWCDSGLVVDLEVAVTAAIAYQEACDPPRRETSRFSRLSSSLLAGWTVGAYLVAFAGVVAGVS